MKKILVSWYGITDLRASLGWEISGPFIAAMRAGQYDEVHVLQYVERGKAAAAEEIDGVSLGIPPECPPPDFINRVCNTPEANAHFMNWLKGKAEKEGLHAAIHSHEVHLEHLNDTNGIYGAAIAVLDKAVGPDVQITLNISPGTAAMAFSWAFAALRYPGTEIRLITSPRANRPPETVELPEGVRERHERAALRSFPNEGEELDVMYHLFGKQRMPALTGVLQFPAKRHVFVTTSEYPADVMENFVPEDECEQIVTDAFEAATFMRDVEEHLASQPQDAKIGFNLTGGTKIMYLCALELCRKYNVLPLYFDLENVRVVNLLDYSTRPNTVRVSIPQVVHLNSRTKLEDCTMSGIPKEDAERKKLSEMLMKNYRSLHRSYKKLAELSNVPKAFALSAAGIDMELTEQWQAKIKFDNGPAFKFRKWPQFAKYLCSGWFEECVYREVFKLLNPSGKLLDIRLNMELRPLNAPSGDLYQELDVVFTDGERLYIIECKSGIVLGEHISKLDSIVQAYGGISGIGILCYAGSLPSRTVCLKALAAGVKLWSFNELKRNLRDLMKL